MYVSYTSPPLRAAAVQLLDWRGHPAACHGQGFPGLAACLLHAASPAAVLAGQSSFGRKRQAACNEDVSVSLACANSRVTSATQ